MPKLKAVATTTTEVTTKVALSTRVIQMLKARAKEYAEQSAIEAAAKQRKKRIGDEVQELFIKEKQGAALLDGTNVDGIGFKLVEGETAKFDKLGFMKRHGLTEEDFQEFTERVPKKSYVAIRLPGAKGDE